MIGQRLLVYSELIDGCSQLFAIQTNIYMYFMLYYAVLCYSLHFWKWVVALRRSKCCPDVIQLPSSSLFPKILSCLDSPTCLSHEPFPAFLLFCSKIRVVQFSLKGNLIIWRPFCRRQFGWFREEEGQRQQRYTSKLMHKPGLKLKFLFFLCANCPVTFIHLIIHADRMRFAWNGVDLLASDTRVCSSAEADAIYQSGMRV